MLLRCGCVPEPSVRSNCSPELAESMSQLPRCQCSCKNCVYHRLVTRRKKKKKKSAILAKGLIDKVQRQGNVRMSVLSETRNEHVVLQVPKKNISKKQALRCKCPKLSPSIY